MDLLDVLLIALAASFAVTGYRQGFIVGALSVLGLLAGGLVGLFLMPRILSSLMPSTLTSVLAICGLLFLAAVGQAVTTFAGLRLRRHVTWEPARLLDAAVGAVASVVSVLIFTWFLGAAIAGSALPWLPNEVRQSALLRGVTEVMPESAQTWFSGFGGLLTRNGFPQVFPPLTEEPIVSVAPPDPALVGNSAVQQAEGSVVKVLGTAPSCGKQIEGSGFFYDPPGTTGTSHLIMTNAHVVAGVQHPSVYLPGSRRGYPATVVLFDPTTDIAILDVSVRHTALRFDDSGAAEDQGVVVGYPEDGPLTAVPARVRSTLDNAGPNIWGQGQNQREIFSLYAQVLPGNSGGPLLSTGGRVYGVVFAKSQEDDNTGYALTARQVAADATAGAGSTTAVGTQGCAL